MSCVHDPSAIVIETLELLRKRPADITLKEIAKATKLNAGWISMFHQGRIVDPSYIRLVKLRNYLCSIK